MVERDEILRCFFCLKRQETPILIRLAQQDCELENDSRIVETPASLASFRKSTMSRVEKTSLFQPAAGESTQSNMSAAKLLGKRTHQIPGKLNVSELFFEVPKDYSNPRSGTLRLFARSVERFEKPVDTSKKEIKQLPWCTHGPLAKSSLSVGITLL